ncbi:MAG: DedA family protein [Bacteroidales bacterium]|nr:DedA family protein [Bacteroidales bacterium]
MESVEFIQWCLNHLDNWTVMFLMAIESSFIPFPSEIVVPPAAYRCADGSALFILIIAATVGANIGSLVNYYLAFYVGRPVIYKFANSRFGHLCLLDEDKVRNAEEYFARHGAISTFIGRLIPAVRQLISIPAGLAKMHLGKFLLFTTLGAGIWNTVLACAGYYMASVYPEDQMMAKIEEYSSEFKIVCFSVIAIVICFLAYKFFSTKKTTSAGNK